MKEVCSRKFANGVVYALETDDGYPIEVTDTFLPYYTKDAIGRKQNALTTEGLGSRLDRWMVGVSTMSGCPVRCKFCATGKLKRWRNLTAEEIRQQVEFVLSKNPFYNPDYSKEFKINYTRMGEPFLNIDEVRKAISSIDDMVWQPHHYISTIGVAGSDFSWITDRVTLQFSVHSLREKYRDWLIPYKRKMSLDQIGEVRTASDLKTTVNLTLVNPEDFDIESLKKYFDPECFFIKLSPINENEVSNKNELGKGVVEQINLV